jgi:hypothetical protein
LTELQCTIFTPNFRNIEAPRQTRVKIVWFTARIAVEPDQGKPIANVSARKITA